MIVLGKEEFLSDEQAQEALKLIGNCKIIELESNHSIHRFNPEVFIKAINDDNEMIGNLLQLSCELC